MIETSVLEVEPGKLDIKSCKPHNLFISLQVGSFFKLAIMSYYRFHVDFMSLTKSFKSETS